MKQVKRMLLILLALTLVLGCSAAGSFAAEQDQLCAYIYGYESGEGAAPPLQTPQQLKFPLAFLPVLSYN